MNLSVLCEFPLWATKIENSETLFCFCKQLFQFGGRFNSSVTGIHKILKIQNAKNPTSFLCMHNVPSINWVCISRINMCFFQVCPSVIFFKNVVLISQFVKTSSLFLSYFGRNSKNEQVCTGKEWNHKDDNSLYFCYL